VPFTSHTPVDLDPLARARAEFGVARALPFGERDRARRLATSAREVVGRSEDDPKLLTRIDAWLASTSAGAAVRAAE
jgi:hypothetical protein